MPLLLLMLAKLKVVHLIKFSLQIQRKFVQKLWVEKWQSNIPCKSLENIRSALYAAYLKSKLFQRFLEFN